MQNCPCCGGDVSTSGVFVDDEFRLVQTTKGAIALGPSQYLFFKSLLTCWPRPAYNQWLTDITGANEVVLRRAIGRLRDKLKPLGLKIVPGCRASSPNCYLLVLPDGTVRETQREARVHYAGLRAAR